VRVVAWTWRSDPGRPGGGDWQRWQSPPLSQRQDWQSAWALAGQWGQTANDSTRAGQIQIHPLSGWQLFVHRGGSWTNPLSSAAVTAGTPDSPNAPPGTTPSATPPTPDGVRLVLSLPPGPAGSGTLTLDWVRPTLSGAPS
jgi:general secretion pathway protein J